MNEVNEKASPIIVNGEAYELINIVSEQDDELIASINSTEIVEKKGYRVDLVKNASQIHFTEI
jgi:hypothetical protein